MTAQSGHGRGRAIAILGLLVVVGAVAYWWTRSSPQAPFLQDQRAAPAVAVRRGPPGPGRPSALEQGLRTLETAGQAFARSHWDAGSVVAEAGHDPEALRGWVQRNTSWVPYRGVLRGAQGVLMDRQGNSLDRALLLSALLTAAGQEHRLAHGVIPRDEAERLLPRLIARRPRTATLVSTRIGDPEAEVREAVTGGEVDAAAIARSISARAGRMQASMETLDARTTEQSAQLLALVGPRARGVTWTERVDTAVEVLRDHWWVQVRRDADWIDLDPDNLDDEDRGLATVTDTFSPAALDSTLYHRIAIRLVAERWTGSALRSATVLDHAMRASDSIGTSLDLRILPEGWPAELGDDRATFTAGFRAAALEQTAWRATLLAGGRMVADVRLEASGRAADAAAGGPFGGLGRGIVDAIGGGSEEQMLTAVWLEYEIRTPDRTPEIIRRTLFDLVGDAGRAATTQRMPALDDSARLRRSLALMRSTEILPLSSAWTPEFLLYLTGESVLQNRDLLRQAASGKLGGRHPTTVPSPVPLPSRLHVLALARFESKDTTDVYLARPNILSRHTFVSPTPTAFRVLEATDIVANEMAVDLSEEDGFAAQVRQGVRDTNAEALLPIEGAAFGSVALAFTEPKRWTVIDSRRGTGTSELPRDAARRIDEEAAGGQIIVAPTRPIRQGGDEFLGWWRIDRRTGRTLGVAENGQGQTMVERAAITIVMVFWFDYLICRGTFLWGQSQEAFAPPFPLSLATPLAALERTPCSVDALVSALVAAGIEIVAVTWPLVLRTIAGKGYNGILSDRPWFATGEGDPGDLPPIFGGKPGATPPEEECPSGGGAAPQPKASEPAPPEEPGAPKPGGEPEDGAGTGTPEAEDPAAAAGNSDQLPHYPNDGEGIRAVPPEQVQERVKSANAARDALEQEVDEALIAWKQAAAAYQQSTPPADRAKATYEEAQRYGPQTPEAEKAYQDMLAAQREVIAKGNKLDEAERDLKRVEYALEWARYRAEWLNRLAAANRAAYDAALARDQATAAWQRTGMTDYNSPEYAAFKGANERYRDAQRQLSDTFRDKPSPPGGTDKTQPAPPQPSMPPTEPAPAPGPSGGGPGAGGGCGGPASPAAQSVGGVAAAGAGVGAAP